MGSRQTIYISSSSSKPPSCPSPSSKGPQFRYILDSDRPLSTRELITTLEGAEKTAVVDDVSTSNKGLLDSPQSASSRTSNRTSHRASGLIPSPRPSPPGSPGPPKSPRPRPKILFYHRHDPHYGFTNFSDHAVEFEGRKYPTSEHLFQSFKFHGHKPDLAEHIRRCSDRPSVAFAEARRFQPEVRPDWKDVNIKMMDVAIEQKFAQHKDLKEELLATGDAELIEDSDKDAFWGVGPNGKGRNELGKALERLRTKFRQGLVT